MSIVTAGLVARGRRASGDQSGAGRRSLVVKRISGIRAAGDAVSAATYVARLGPAWQRDGVQALVLFDEFGEAVPPTALRNHVSDWDLAPEAENLTPAARDVVARDGFGAVASWPVKKRQRNVQMHHLVVSISGKDEDAEALWVAGREAVRQIFTEEGHRRVLWTVHTDRPGHPHLHLLVKSLEEDDGTGRRRRRLRFDKHREVLDGYSAIFARQLDGVGLYTEASRREDREEVRAAVLRGDMPLRRGYQKSQVRQARDGSSRPHYLLEDAPDWFLSYGADYLRRKAVMRRRRREAAAAAKASQEPYLQKLREQLPKRPRVLRFRRVPAEAAELYEAVKDLFVEPEKAIERYLALSTEGAVPVATPGQWSYPRKALADWYLLHQPLAYGDLTQNASLERGPRGVMMKPLRPENVRAALGRLKLPAPVVQPIRRGALEEVRRAMAAAKEEEVLSGVQSDRFAMVQSLKRLAASTAQHIDSGVEGSRSRAIARVADDLARTVNTRPERKPVRIPRRPLGRDGTER